MLKLRIPSLLIILCLVQLSCYSQSIDKACYVALEHIWKGYMTYGAEQMQIAATNNSLPAQFYMGQCFEFGIGVEKNEAEAFGYYRKAAERGLPDAMYRISTFYSSGTVVRQDESRKQEWLNRFNRKGGKCILPDIMTIYNEGIKHVENYALNPSEINTGGPNNEDSDNNTALNNQTVNNITIVQHVAQPAKEEQHKDDDKLQPQSDVDINIPTVTTQSDNTFAWIIANEDYQNVAKVPNALNDGKVFAEYCEKTLGMPKSNIHLVANATYNNIKRELNLMKQIADAYNGEGRFIVYYAGHGLPDESSKTAYLLPIDGYSSDMTTCYSLNDFYKTLGDLSQSKVVVFLDACFSGSLRGDGMLASARGIAIKAKASVPQGNTLVLSAAQGDETAYSYNEKGHGMFTYYLLKKLQETEGNVSLGDLFLYIKDNVVKKSLVINAKSQTPCSSASSAVADDWQSWTLKP